MGQLIEGRWYEDGRGAPSAGGRFVRGETSFRDWLTADGEPGPSGESGSPAEAGRYHLYVSLACPWAHRTLVFRRLKGLESTIGVTVVHPDMLEEGWVFAPDPEPLGGFTHLHQVYTRADPGYSGRVTVPALWDRERGTIVNNESAEIIRMFNSAFNGVGAREGDYCPAELKGAIERQDRRLEQLKANRRRIFEEQKRIRDNLGRVPSNSDLHRRYIEKLGVQEDNLERLAAETVQSEEERNQALERLEDRIAALKL